MKCESIDEAFEELQKQIEILKSRAVIRPEVVSALERVRATLFGFGFYDPETKRDMELARLLKDDMDVIMDAFKI